jgi:hypothetical protein
MRTSKLLRMHAEQTAEQEHSRQVQAQGMVMCMSHPQLTCMLTGESDWSSERLFADLAAQRGVQLLQERVPPVLREAAEAAIHGCSGH